MGHYASEMLYPEPANPERRNNGTMIERVKHSKWLHEMADEVYDLNVRKGWYDESRSFSDEIALLASEVFEAFDSYRDIGLESHTAENGKPDDVASEFADVLIRLLDTCRRYDIDLQAEYERKMAYNRTRPYRHGGKKL